MRSYSKGAKRTLKGTFTWPGCACGLAAGSDSSFFPWARRSCEQITAQFPPPHQHARFVHICAHFREEWQTKKGGQLLTWSYWLWLIARILIHLIFYMVPPLLTITLWGRWGWKRERERGLWPGRDLYLDVLLEVSPTSKPLLHHPDSPKQMTQVNKRMCRNTDTRWAAN